MLRARCGGPHPSPDLSSWSLDRHAKQGKKNVTSPCLTRKPNRPRQPPPPSSPASGSPPCWAGGRGRGGEPATWSPGKPPPPAQDRNARIRGSLGPVPGAPLDALDVKYPAPCDQCESRDRGTRANRRGTRGAPAAQARPRAPRRVRHAGDTEVGVDASENRSVRRGATAERRRGRVTSWRSWTSCQL